MCMNIVLILMQIMNKYVLMCICMYKCFYSKVQNGNFKLLDFKGFGKLRKRNYHIKLIDSAAVTIT